MAATVSVSATSVTFALGAAAQLALSAQPNQLELSGLTAPDRVRVSNVAMPLALTDAVPWEAVVNTIVPAAATPFAVPSNAVFVAVDSSAQSIQVDLPSAALSALRELTVVDQARNCEQYNIVIVPNGADLVQGEASAVLEVDGSSLTLLCDGVSSWMVV